MEETTWKWELRYLDMAKLVSGWSKDPGTKVGAVVVGKHGQILSTGYNGFARGVKDTPARLTDRATKLTMTIHAEMNCVFNASLSGISLEGSTLYVYGLPTCSECTKGVIQSGISRLVIPFDTINKSDFWKTSWEHSSEMLREAGVDVVILKDV